MNLLNNNNIFGKHVKGKEDNAMNIPIPIENMKDALTWTVKRMSPRLADRMFDRSVICLYKNGISNIKQILSFIYFMDNL